MTIKINQLILPYSKPSDSTKSKDKIIEEISLEKTFVNIGDSSKLSSFYGYRLINVVVRYSFIQLQFESHTQIDSTNMKESWLLILEKDSMEIYAV